MGGSRNFPLYGKRSELPEKLKSYTEFRINTVGFKFLLYGIPYQYGRSPTPVMISELRPNIQLRKNI